MTDPSTPLDAASGDRIRRARPDDLPAILDIESAAFEPARRSSRASLARALRSGFQQVLVLEVATGAAAKLAGYLVLWPFRRTWRIYNLATDRRWRNRGIGSALVAAAVEAARAGGAERLVLESRREPELVRFYEQRGFRIARRLPDYYGSGQDAVRMELYLAAAL